VVRKRTDQTPGRDIISREEQTPQRHTEPFGRGLQGENRLDKSWSSSGIGALSGIVYLSHQTGAILGAWLGGRLFDITGSYEITWWIAVTLGVITAMIHYPIERTSPATDNA